MPENKLIDYTRRVREYLDSPEGHRNTRENMRGRGWSYERVVAEAVMFVTRLVIYERIEAVARAVRAQELAA